MSSISVSLRSSLSVDEDNSRGGGQGKTALSFFFRQNIIHILDMALSSAGSGRASTEEPSCEREPLPHQYSVAMVGACGVGKTTLIMKFMSSKHETEGGNLNRANFILLRESIYYENTVLKPNAIMLYFIQFSG